MNMNTPAPARSSATGVPLLAVDDVTHDPRFSWVRGLDLEGQARFRELLQGR